MSYELGAKPLTDWGLGEGGGGLFLFTRFLCIAFLGIFGSTEIQTIRPKKKVVKGLAGAHRIHAPNFRVYSSKIGEDITRRKCESANKRRCLVIIYFST